MAECDEFLVCEAAQALFNDSSDSDYDYLKTVITGIYCMLWRLYSQCNRSVTVYHNY